MGLLAFWTLFILLINEVLENCATKEKYECHHATERVYNKVENEILRKINEAKSTFTPCSFNNCSCYKNVIKRDLQPFNNGITVDMFVEAQKSGVKYQLIDHRLYRQRDCMFPSRCSGIEYFINKIRNELDDFEIVINPRDWPQIGKYAKHPLPVFSFSKTEDYFDIMYPAWSFWEGGPAISLYPAGLGHWEEHVRSIKKAAKKWPWEKKKNLAFFRGSRTSPERDILVRLSREYPDFIDSAYTKNQAWKSLEDTLGALPAKEISLEDHCKYRYLFNFRGVAASFRLRHLFLCESLVFHVGNEWIEFFYEGLKPWIHYVPISSHASQEDYRSLLDFFNSHESLAREIGNAGSQFINSHLKMSDIVCYWKLLLQEYILRVNYKPVLDEKLIDVTK